MFAARAAVHSNRPDAIGPSPRGFYGRKSASRDDFRYSNAMARPRLVWDEANLRTYLSNPQAKVPGDRMPLAGCTTKKTSMARSLAYLKTYR